MKVDIRFDIFMLQALFGNKTIERILIFLFVNSKCYGTQLHRSLNTPLTPVQKALLRLEKGGIITSYYEGKTRLFRFNPAFPVLSELEQLLKKTYTLLSAHEKKAYFITREDHVSQAMSHRDKLQVVLHFWDKLAKVQQLNFQAKTQAKEEGGWNGNGKGVVSIKRELADVLIFQEKGSWLDKQGNEIGFSNVFRWSLDKNSCLISLEHLRYGINHPVFLFYLAPSGNTSLVSVDSHLCDGDSYFGQVHFDDHTLKLNWRVIGLKKNEEINCYYSWLKH